MEHGFTWFGWLGSYADVTTAALVAALLIVFAAIVSRRLSDTQRAITPDDGVTGRSVAEAITEAISGMAESVLGHGGERYVPLLATFFVFILASNLLGLVPGFYPPTSSFSITLGLGLISFAAYHTAGVREHGFKYVKQFIGSVLFLAPLMLVVELFSHAFRPISLGIRLFANMFADHQVVSIFIEKTYVIVPIAFYVLGAFVCVVQAFVFTMLSAIYIGLAVSHDH